MGEENKFSAEKIGLKTFRINNFFLETPNGFDFDLVEGHNMNTSFKTGFNLSKKAAKADILIDIITKSKEEQEEAECRFDLSYFFDIENIEELVTQEEDDNGLLVDATLLSNIAGIAYSTTRGNLMNRLQGTVFSRFIMPIINPEELLEEQISDK